MYAICNNTAKWSKTGNNGCVRVKDLYQQHVSKADIMCKTNTMKNQSNFNSTELDRVKELTAHVDW